MGARGRCLAVVLALGLLTSSSSAKGPKCFPREGHCVAVKVNGQSSVEVGKQTRKLLRDLEEVHYSVDDTRYELVTPVRGDFEILADRAVGSEEWLGEVREVDASVVPLQQVELLTHREQEIEETVRVGGAAAVGDQDVLDENRLPAGRYLLVVTLRGESNWDRQVLFFEVAGE